MISNSKEQTLLIGHREQHMILQNVGLLSAVFELNNLSLNYVEYEIRRVKLGHA